jgi:hypothetical protein
VKARALVVGVCGIVLTGVLVAACGGRVDNSPSSGTTAGTGSDPTPRLPPPSSGRPGRQPSPVTAASVGSEIAETYCKAFSSCCVGAGQPPVDVARCRTLVAAEIESNVSPGALLEAEDVAGCIDTIKGRIGLCSAVDAPWWASSNTLAILAPASVKDACLPLFGFTPTGNKPIPCTSNASCIGLASQCAIDECVAAGPLGIACKGVASCLDGESCIAGTCSAPLDVPVKGECASGDDCRLGLICVKGICLPSRDFPGVGGPRFSPYRIGADTCGAYQYL